MNVKQIIAEAAEYFDRADIQSDFESDLRSLLEIDGVAGAAEGEYPYGERCAAALLRGLALGEKYGFTAENHEYHCGSIIMGDNKREVGIAAHLDVVPCGNGWTKPPYALTVEDGKYYGRGTQDDKGPFCITLYAMRYLAEKGIDLPFSIRLIAGSDEEVGSSDLRYYKTVRKAPWFSFTPDSTFPVCIGEKDIILLRIALGGLPAGLLSFEGGSVTNAVPDSASATIADDGRALPECERISVERSGGIIRITASGRGAHAAMPETGINAIGLLSAYLLSAGIVSDEATRFVAAATASTDGSALGIDRTDADFGGLTCVASVIGVQDRELTLTFNIRAIPGDPIEATKASIASAVGAYGLKIKSLFHNPGYRFSADDAKINSLTRSCEAVLGVECKPYTMGGGTYARELEGCVAFGAELPGHYSDSESGGAHQRDEFLLRDSARKAFEIYVLSLISLAEGLNDGTIA